MTDATTPATTETTTRPTTAPPERSGPSWRVRLGGPALVLAVAFSTLAIGLTARRPGVEDAGGAARFVPADGHIDAALIVDAAGTHSERIVQHGRLSGATIVTSVPTSFDTIPEVLAEQDIELRNAQFWTQSSQEFADGAPDARVQSVSVIAPTGIADLIVYGGRFSFVYSPPIMTLPASPTIGATWEQQGDAFPRSVVRYDTSGTVIAAPDADDRANGCLATRAEVRYTLGDEASTPLLTLKSTDTWCPGRGIVHSTGTLTGEVTTPLATITSVSLHDLAASRRPLVPTPVEVATIDSSFGLEAEPIPVQFDDVLLGRSSLATMSSFTPLPFPDDSIVIVDSTSGDLVGLHDTGASLDERWRRHPGGTILSVSSVAGLVVVTSSDRRVTAYTPEGVPRWSHVLDDIVTSGATAAGGVVVLGTMGNTVHGIRADDGDRRWTRELPDVVRAPPSTTGPLAVLALRDGTTTAVTANGKQVWTVATGNVDAVVADTARIALVTTDDVVVQLSPATGEELARTPLLGTFDSVVLGAGQLVALTDEQTAGIEAGSGDVRWTTGPARGALPHAAGVILRTRTGLRGLDLDGAATSVWPYDKGAVTDPRFATAPDWLVPSGNSVLVIDQNLLVARLAARDRR